MGPCTGQNHPQVPITMVSIQVVYCWSCQGWVIYAGRATQHDESETHHEAFTEDYLGPFDGLDRVLELARGYLIDLLTESGLPWDPGDWNPTP
jgi:hypothetical protein